MKRIISLFCLAIALFLSSTVFSNELIRRNEIVKGQLAKINTEEATVWIKTNQAQDLAKGTVLYVHSENDATIAIMKVLQNRHRYIQAKVIDGQVSKLKEGDKVNNVYEWDGYRYFIEVTYKQGKHIVTVEDYLTLENEIPVSSNFGGNRQEIDGRNISIINLTGTTGNVRVTGFIFKDGKTINADFADIPTLKKYNDRVVKASVGSGQVTVNAAEIHSIKIKKRLRGALKMNWLHYAKGESALPVKKDNGYEVQFKFFNYELGLKAIERLIAAEEDEAALAELIKNLKAYDKDKIKSVTIAGTFNDWDTTKNVMARNRYGVYESKVMINETAFQYHYILHYNGVTPMKLKVLDPYANRLNLYGSKQRQYDPIKDDEPLKDDNSDKMDKGDGGEPVVIKEPVEEFPKEEPMVKEEPKTVEEPKKEEIKIDDEPKDNGKKDNDADKDKSDKDNAKKDDDEVEEPKPVNRGGTNKRLWWKKLKEKDDVKPKDSGEGELKGGEYGDVNAELGREQNWWKHIKNKGEEEKNRLKD